MLSPAVKNRPDGRTAGEALDAIASQLTDEENRTLVIVQKHKAEMAWWDKIAGTFKEDEAHQEAMNLGCEYRSAQKSNESTADGK